MLGSFEYNILFNIVLTVTLSLKEREVKLDVPISKKKSPTLILKYRTLGFDTTFRGLTTTFYLCFSLLQPIDITLSITYIAPSRSYPFKVKFFSSSGERLRNITYTYSPSSIFYIRNSLKLATSFDIRYFLFDSE
jgi:hypothetical protein